MNGTGPRADGKYRDSGARLKTTSYQGHRERSRAPLQRATAARGCGRPHGAKDTVGKRNVRKHVVGSEVLAEALRAAAESILLRWTEFVACGGRALAQRRAATCVGGRCRLKDVAALDGSFRAGRGTRVSTGVAGTGLRGRPRCREKVVSTLLGTGRRKPLIATGGNRAQRANDHGRALRRGLCGLRAGGGRGAEWIEVSHSRIIGLPRKRLRGVRSRDKTCCQGLGTGSREPAPERLQGPEPPTIVSARLLQAAAYPWF